MEIEIYEIEPAIALRFCKQFTKEHVDVKEVEGTHYLGAFANGLLVGCCGWVMIGSVLRYKADCVLRNYRGNGIYEKLFKFRELSTVHLYRKKTTAFCTDKSLNTYIRHGFCSITTNGNGITFVERKYEEL